MKKSFFFLAVSALALSACSSEAEIDVGPQSNPIGFENAVMKPSRAGDQAITGDLTNATFDKFLVYGFYTKEHDASNPIQVFSGEIVTKQSGNSWTYSNTRYWVPKASYNFYAYSCGDIALDNLYGTVGLSLNGDTDARQLTFSNYRCDQSHNHDLILAVSKNNIGQEKTPTNPTPNANVALNFEHILTKIDAIFTSEFSSDYDVVIKDVKISNFRNIGSFTSNAKIWTAERETNSTGVTVSASIQLPFADGEGVACAAVKNAQGTVIKEEKKPKTGSVFMIPFSYLHSDVQISFVLELYKGTNHTPDNIVMSRNMSGTWSPKWELGKYYTYNVRLTGTVANLQPIVFETSSDMNLDNWTSGASTATDISFSTN